MKIKNEKAKLAKCFLIVQNSTSKGTVQKNKDYEVIYKYKFNYKIVL